MIFQLTQFIEAYLEKHNKKPLSFYEQMLLRQKQQELEERERELRVYIYIYISGFLTSILYFLFKNYIFIY